ncbi:hypothetical protein E4T44_12173 [Aureobasidium sp. EXF-8845]|nr:hypothetical protein E4T44_12173 [Aureobasidium sp. EXF-8845]
MAHPSSLPAPSSPKSLMSLRQRTERRLSTRTTPALSPAPTSTSISAVARLCSPDTWRMCVSRRQPDREPS